MRATDEMIAWRRDFVGRWTGHRRNGILLSLPTFGVSALAFWHHNPIGVLGLLCGWALVWMAADSNARRAHLLEEISELEQA